MQCFLRIFILHGKSNWAKTFFFIKFWGSMWRVKMDAKFKSSFSLFLFFGVKSWWPMTPTVQCTLGDKEKVPGAFLKDSKRFKELARYLPLSHPSTPSPFSSSLSWTYLDSRICIQAAPSPSPCLGQPLREHLPHPPFTWQCIAMLRRWSIIISLPSCQLQMTMSRKWSKIIF